MKAADLAYSQITEGAGWEFQKKITRADGEKFAGLSGDFNPLHLDEKFGEQSPFGQNIAHGMLLGSLFSALVGMYCPGRRALYLSQNLNFKAPVFYGDVVTVKGTVVGKNDSIRMLTLKTEILKDGKVCVTGQAKVKVNEDEND